MPGEKTEKYHRILNSAGAVFAELGFDRATVAQVAETAGVADGTLYLYFKNKEDILYQFIRFRAQKIFPRLNRAVGKGETAEEKLRSLIRCHLSEFQKDRDMTVVFMSEVRYLRQLRSQIKDISRIYLDLLSDIIEQGQLEGSMPRDIFAGLVKRFILGGAQGVISTWVKARGRYDMVPLADPLVDLYLLGMKKPA